jgi:hypothetical protein
VPLCANLCEETGLWPGKTPGLKGQFLKRLGAWRLIEKVTDQVAEPMAGSNGFLVLH